MKKKSTLVNGLPRNRRSRAVPISQTQIDDMRETPFQTQVIELAERCGFYVYHTHNSRRSKAGFPDLTMIRPPRVVFAELKRGKGGRVTPDQADVLALLHRCPGVETYLWNPNDWSEVCEVLTRRRGEQAR